MDVVAGPSERMLALLSLLQARRDWPGYVLAQRLDVTTRTVRRDVDRLRALGYRIESTKGPDGGYRLAAGSELPPLLFDEEQAVAIAVGLQHAAASGVDVGRVREALLGGSAWSKALDDWGGRMVSRDFAPGIEARLHHKDFGILMNEAMSTGVPLPIAAQVWQRMFRLKTRRR